MQIDYKIISTFFFHSLSLKKLAENEAATAIQATFRGYKTRKQMRENSIANSRPDSGEQAQSKISNNQPQLETVNEMSSSSIVTANSDNSPTNTRSNTNELDTQKNLDEAATKIQANFRGFKTRKDLKKGILLLN